MPKRHFRIALLLSGLRWRGGSSIAMFVVAVFGAGIGAFGPIYLHSADQSILNGILSRAPTGNTGLTLETKSGDGSRTRLLAAAADVVPQPGGGKRWFGTALSTDIAGITTQVDGQPYVASLVSRTDVCAHLSIVSGNCAEHLGTVMLSTRSAQELGVRLGQRLVTSFAGSRRAASLVIVGLYKPGNASASYWWGENLFAFGTGTPMKPDLDAVFASAATLRAAAPRSLTSYMLQLPYQPGSMAVDSLARFRTSLATYQKEVLEKDEVIVTTRLPQLLLQVTTTEHIATAIVAAIDLQLVLLALYVLYFISSRTAAEREPDIRLAEIRGFRPRSTLAVALAEPIAIVTAAVPVGVLAAWVVALRWASGLFGPGVSASVTLLALAAAISTGLVGVAATALGTRRMLASVLTTSALDSGTTAQRYTTWTVVAEAAGVAIAGAAFVELAVVGVSTIGMPRADPLAAFAPGLAALALGILGARLLPPVLRLTFRFTSHSNKIALALATRWIARRRETASQVILLSIAVGLTSFGVCGWAIAARNRTVQSEFDVGAPRVLTVAVRPGVKFLPAVREADPSGRSAMAVVVENASDGTTLAVDSSRMKHFISWPPGLGAGGVEQVKRRLVPNHLAPAVMVSGAAVQVIVDADVDVQPAPQLSLDLFDEGFQTSQQVALGSLSSGFSTYRGSLQGLCPAGCRLVDLAITWAPPITSVAPTGSVDLVISSLSQRSAKGGWQAIPAGLTDVHRWYSPPTGGARLESEARGLHARVELDPDGSPVTIAPADVPKKLPGVVTPSSSMGSDLSGGLSFAGLDGDTIPGRAIGQVPALPRVGADATLVDLDMAQRFLSGPPMNDTTEVWLSDVAPASIVTRLAAQGISVLSVDSATAHERAMVHDGVALAYTLFLISAVTAAVLAVGATAFAVAAGARRREGELAALRAVGLRAGSLRRSLEVEQGLTLGAGVLCGAGAGIAAIAVALKSVPEFVALGPGPPLELGLPMLVLSVTLGALIFALGLTVAVSAAVFVRRASADKLGGVQM